MKDAVLVIAPAAFGLLGTVLGALLAQRAAAGERQVKEDNEARKALAELLEPLLRASGSYAIDASGRTVFLAPSQVTRLILSTACG